VTVLWGPALDRPPLEGICQYWRIAVVETAQFFRPFLTSEIVLELCGLITQPTR
jgi:hypothetical protein